MRTIAEKVTDLGGSAVLTEVPEMFGAETQLMNRADSEETFGKVVAMINGFKQYYMDYNQPIYENPSPGNKRGGITTLEEKSLGCIQKGGHATVTDTLEFGEQCVKPGLNLMTGPGNDSVSITDLLASGVQLLLFTTGRGNRWEQPSPPSSWRPTLLYMREKMPGSISMRASFWSGILSTRHRRNCGNWSLTWLPAKSGQRVKNPVTRKL